MKIVVLTGAGISAESGLGTFRSNDGLWEKYRIEEVATPEAWEANPKLVLDFYNERRKNNNSAKPNDAHFALTKLQYNFNVSIITQNIDDLHERAGTTNITHLHGEILKAKTSESSTDYYAIKKDIKLGDLGKDGKQLRPHVVWFGEAVPQMDVAIQTASEADLLIVIGTSLKVYPAASLINYTSNSCEIIVIDPNETNLNSASATYIKEKASIALPKLVKDLIHKKRGIK